MYVAQMICLLLSVVTGVMATTGVPSSPYFQWLPASVMFLALSLIVGGTFPVR